MSGDRELWARVDMTGLGPPFISPALVNMVNTGCTGERGWRDTREAPHPYLHQCLPLEIKKRGQFTQNVILPETGLSG